VERARRVRVRVRARSPIRGVAVRRLLTARHGAATIVTQASLARSAALPPRRAFHDKSCSLYSSVPCLAQRWRQAMRRRLTSPAQALSSRHAREGVRQVVHARDLKLPVHPRAEQRVKRASSGSAACAVKQKRRVAGSDDAIRYMPGSKREHLQPCQSSPLPTDQQISCQVLFFLAPSATRAASRRYAPAFCPVSCFFAACLFRYARDYALPFFVCARINATARQMMLRSAF